MLWSNEFNETTSGYKSYIKFELIRAISTDRLIPALIGGLGIIFSAAKSTERGD